METERKTLTQLSVPICLETLFYMLSGMVDTLMLSSVSDQAVGAVGTANTYIGVFIIMFGVISSGMIAVMSQNIGAGRPGIAYQARQLGLIFNALIGIVMSVVLATFSGGILRIVVDAIADTPLHKKLSLPQSGNQYEKGKQDLFAVVIAFRYILPGKDFLEFKRKLIKEIDRVNREVDHISEVELLNKMGFPKNWKNITRYHLN